MCICGCIPFNRTKISRTSVIFVAVRIARALIAVRAHYTTMRLRVVASSQLSQQITSILTYILHVSCIQPHQCLPSYIFFQLLINERVYFCCFCTDNWQYAWLTREHSVSHESVNWNVCQGSRPHMSAIFVPTISIDRTIVCKQKTCQWWIQRMAASVVFEYTKWISIRGRIGCVLH